MVKPIMWEQMRKLSHKDQVRFALFCDYQVKHKWTRSIKAKKAIELVELWLEGKATKEECDIILNDKYNSISTVYCPYSIYVIAYGDYTTNTSACDASYYAISAFDYDYKKKKIIKAQRKYYKELKDFDSIFEKIVLEG